MIAHVWGMLVPVGEYAARTNLLSALFSAAGAGCFFLVAHESLAARSSRGSASLAAAAGAIIGAFTFTNWQNSNETEVYAVATFTIAAMCVAGALWRGGARRPRATRLLLLDRLSRRASRSETTCSRCWRARPSSRSSPSRSGRADARPEVRRRSGDRSLWWPASGRCWSAPGSGAPALVASRALSCFWPPRATRARGGAGCSRSRVSSWPWSVSRPTVPVPPVRAAPTPQRGCPGHLRALLAVIRRAQYPPRTPLDDPTVLSGHRQPGPLAHASRRPAPRLPRLVRLAVGQGARRGLLRAAPGAHAGDARLRIARASRPLRQRRSDRAAGGCC